MVKYIKKICFNILNDKKGVWRKLEKRKTKKNKKIKKKTKKKRKGVSPER